MPSDGSRTRARDALLTFGFLAAIAAPPIGAMFGSDAAQSVLGEFRKPQPFPQAPRSLEEASEWPKRFETWFGDHFGLREPLLRGRSRVLWDAFGASPTNKFVHGRDDWVFATHARSLDVYRGAYPMSPARVEGWREMLAARGAWFAAHGARYYVVIAPSKELVYGDFLPERLREPGTTRVDQLMEVARGIDNCEVIDLRACLREERTRDGGLGTGDLTYYPLGTHWTDRGAFAADVEVARRLARAFPSIHPFAREDFSVERFGEGDSLASQLYLDGRLSQPAWMWKLGDKRRARYDDANITFDGEFQSEVDDPSLPRAVVLHDSFGFAIRQMLAEHFSRAKYVWGLAYDLALFEQEQPDVVIELFIDRALGSSAPQLWPVGDPARSRAAFEASPRVALALDAAGVAANVTAGEHSILRRADDGARVRSNLVPPSILLPRFELARDERITLRLRVNSARESGVDLFFTKTTEKTFEQVNQLHASLARGDNELDLEVFDDDLDGGLMLRFADPRCIYVVQSVEVRARR